MSKSPLIHILLYKLWTKSETYTNYFFPLLPNWEYNSNLRNNYNFTLRSYGFHFSGTPLCNAAGSSLDCKWQARHSSRRSLTHPGHAHCWIPEEVPWALRHLASSHTCSPGTHHRAAWPCRCWTPECNHGTWKNLEQDRIRDQIAGSWCSYVCTCDQIHLCLSHIPHSLHYCTWLWCWWCHTSALSHGSVPPQPGLKAASCKLSTAVPAFCYWQQTRSSKLGRIPCLVPMPAGISHWLFGIPVNQPPQCWQSPKLFLEKNKTLWLSRSQLGKVPGKVPNTMTTKESTWVSTITITRS